MRMRASFQRRSKKLKEGKLIASEEDAEKSTDKGILSVNLTWKKHFFNAMCPIAIGTSVAAYTSHDNPVVACLGSMCSFLSFSSAYLQHKIRYNEQLRDLVDHMKEEAAFCREEHKQLKDANDEYEGTIEKLEKAEDALLEIAEKGGRTVDEVIKQVEELKRTQARLQESTYQQIVHTIASILLAVDRDDNFFLDDREADELIFRIKINMMITDEGVKLDEEKFRKVIRENNLSGIIDVINKNVRGIDLPEEKIIFIYPNED